MTMQTAVVALSLAAMVVAGANGASLFDLLNWDDAETLSAKQVQGQENSKNCMCKGQACICCVDLNITFVDLGGPGCVHMKYLSPEEGFAVNVSYGKSLLHKSNIKGANSPPICLDVFGKFAQMCARFSELAPTADGLRGCLQLEPRLLGDTQLEFPIGCFRSSATGMEMEEIPEAEQEFNQGANNTEQNGDTNEGEEEGSVNAEDFLTLVNHTAEQGIALFSSFLGIVPVRNTTSTASPQNVSTSVSETEAIETPSEDPQSRRGKSIQHPNKL